VHYLNETPFKIAFGVLLVIAGLGRRILGGNWRERRKKTVRRETGPLFLSIVFFPAYGSLFLYFCTSWLDPFHVPLPVWLSMQSPGFGFPIACSLPLTIAAWLLYLNLGALPLAGIIIVIRRRKCHA